MTTCTSPARGVYCLKGNDTRHNAAIGTAGTTQLQRCLLSKYARRTISLLDRLFSISGLSPRGFGRSFCATNNVLLGATREMYYPSVTCLYDCSSGLATHRVLDQLRSYYIRVYGRIRFLGRDRGSTLRGGVLS